MTKVHTSKAMPTIKRTILAGILTIGAMGAATTASQAMIIYNCTNQTLQLIMEGKSNTKFPGRVAANSKIEIHTPKRYGPYRIVLPTLGPGGYFSGRSWNGTFSLKSSAGNIGIRNGNACPPAIVEPDRPITGPEDYPRAHYLECFVRYRSYDPKTNSYQPLGSGRRRQCYTRFN